MFNTKISFLNLLFPPKGIRPNGFTLLELMIVMMMGIFSAVAIPYFISQIAKARET